MYHSHVRQPIAPKHEDISQAMEGRGPHEINLKIDVIVRGLRAVEQWGMPFELRRRIRRLKFVPLPQFALSRLVKEFDPPLLLVTEDVKREPRKEVKEVLQSDVRPEYATCSQDSVNSKVRRHHGWWKVDARPIRHVQAPPVAVRRVV